MMRFSVWSLVAALSLGAVFPAVATAQSRSHRPTPRQAIEQALTPVREAVDALHVTDAERASIADVLSRAEVVAAGIVEADFRSNSAVAQAHRAEMATLARVVRGRVEASRAETTASERERQALESESRRTLARAALERAVERQAELERRGSSTPPASEPQTPARPTQGSSSTPAPARGGAR